MTRVFNKFSLVMGLAIVCASSTAISPAYGFGYSGYYYSPYYSSYYYSPYYYAGYSPYYYSPYYYAGYSPYYYSPYYYASYSPYYYSPYYASYYYTPAYNSLAYTPYVGSYTTSPYNEQSTYYTDNSGYTRPANQPFTTTSFSRTADASDRTAHLRVIVPDPNADVVVDGARTSSTGTVRQFRSPALDDGTYTYEVRATWLQDGQTRTKTEKIKVSPGSWSVINFPGTSTAQ
jgi:uncharacterized protein (TIGR03000 family)